MCVTYAIGRGLGIRSELGSDEDGTDAASALEGMMETLEISDSDFW